MLLRYEKKKLNKHYLHFTKHAIRIKDEPTSSKILDKNQLRCFLSIVIIISIAKKTLLEQIETQRVDD